MERDRIVNSRPLISVGRYSAGAIALLREKRDARDWAKAKRQLTKSGRHDGNARCCWNTRWRYGMPGIERRLSIEPVYMDLRDLAHSSLAEAGEFVMVAQAGAGTK
jgi:hypothetical protein